MSALTIDIRPATERDAYGIAETHARSWQYAYAGILPHINLRQMINRRDAHWWARAIERGTSVQIVEMDGIIVGYVTYGLNRARSLPQDGEIYELYLRPEYQGVGLGRRLFNAAKDDLHRHGCKGMVVWALEDNDAANAFYEVMGGKDLAEGHERFSGVTLKKIAWVWA